MSKSSQQAPAPDPNIGLAQKQLADLSEKYYQNWSTEVWPTMKEATLKQETRADEQFALDKATQEKQLAAADVAMKEYTEKGTPLREDIYKQAEKAGSEAEIERQSALAMGDVKGQMDVAEQTRKRELQAYGIDPTSGRYTGAANANQVMGAAAGAAAATKARDAAVQLGWAKKMDAAALAQGQYGNQATSTGLGLAAGNQALASGQTGVANAGAMGSSLSQGYGGVMSGWGQVGQLGVQKYNADVNAYSAQQQANAGASAGIGSAVGSVLGGAMKYGLPLLAASDIRTKENIELVGYLPNGLPVYEYEYKDEFKDHELAGHGRHRGVMAQDVEKVIPEAVVVMDNGYKAVDYAKVY